MTDIHAREILFNEFAHEYITQVDIPHDESVKGIYGLSPINFFVGANNSGKSRLLRALASSENLAFKPAMYPKSFDELKAGALQKITQSEAHIKDIKARWRQLEYITAQTNISGVTEQLNNVISTYAQANGASARSYASQLSEKINSYSQEIQGANVKSRLYIPVLRGLRPFSYGDNQNAVDIYKERTLKDYFKSKGAGLEIYTGLSLYSDLRALLLGSHEQR